ncbi:MAG: prepilin-type N-terminal cleavage/methylation domain-containing protein [Planctomycetota bacterium]|nr:prepilin-type N-terminal cleavage/methylation domain-containing protein [Planctomycetota bacterium]
MKTHCRGRGFTLVELLVVIGIIAVLIAILFSVISKVRDQANQVRCMANLRAIGQAMACYTDTYKHYPGGWINTYYGNGPCAIWPTRLRGVVRGSQKVFYCPARDERFEWRTDAVPGSKAVAPAAFAGYGYKLGEPLLLGGDTPDSGTPFSYGYNVYGASGLGPVNRRAAPPRGLGGLVIESYEAEVRVSRVRAPAEMIAVADASGSAAFDFILSPTADDAQYRRSPGNVHRGGANVLFCDGHVQWYLQRDLVLGRWPPLPTDDAVRCMWNRDRQP